MSNIEIIDLIKYANENQPVNFASALDNILSQKTLEVLAAKREEVAANMFKDPEDEDEEYDDEDDYDDDGIDVEELETDEDIELEDDGETDD
jgi:hypothetical protein